MKAVLSDWPLDRPRNWVALVNEPMSEPELKAIRRALARNRPYGAAIWQEEQARRLGLLHMLRSEGRPKKE